MNLSRALYCKYAVLLSLALASVTAEASLCANADGGACDVSQTLITNGNDRTEIGRDVGPNSNRFVSLIDRESKGETDWPGSERGKHDARFDHDHGQDWGRGDEDERRGGDRHRDEDWHADRGEHQHDGDGNGVPHPVPVPGSALLFVPALLFARWMIRRTA